VAEIEVRLTLPLSLLWLIESPLCKRLGITKNQREFVFSCEFSSTSGEIGAIEVSLALDVHSWGADLLQPASGPKVPLSIPWKKR
jgi:hypothetical protein